MDKPTIEALMQKAETKFNELNQFQETVKSKLKEWGLTEYSELQEEMNRLQGDFRTLDSVRSSIPEPQAQTTSEPAKTIEATPAPVVKETPNGKRPVTTK